MTLSWKRIRQQVMKPLMGPKVPFFDMMLVSVQCQMCKKQFARPEIQIHHLNPKSERPDMKYMVENLIALCPKCHQRIHAAYALFMLEIRRKA
jgi:5-methylcytosine-specific restriction endonuclease McrA